MSAEHIAGTLVVAGLAVLYGAFILVCISVAYFGDEMRKMHRQAALLTLIAAALIGTAALIPNQ